MQNGLPSGEPNRLEDGTYDFAGDRYRLPLTEPTTGNAIHGLVRWVAWAVVEPGEDRVVPAIGCIPDPVTRSLSSSASSTPSTRRGFA
jgi:galactose mutarotase-like enzyme